MTVPSPSPARRPKRQVGKEAGERLGEKQARVASILLPAPSWGPGWKPSVRGRTDGMHLSMPASTGTQPTAVSDYASLHQDGTSLRALSRPALPPSELEGREDQLEGFPFSPWFLLFTVCNTSRDTSSSTRAKRGESFNSTSRQPQAQGRLVPRASRNTHVYCICPLPPGPLDVPNGCQREQRRCHRERHVLFPASGPLFWALPRGCTIVRVEVILTRNFIRSGIPAGGQGLLFRVLDEQRLGLV